MAQLAVLLVEVGNPSVGSSRTAGSSKTVCSLKSVRSSSVAKTSAKDVYECGDCHKSLSSSASVRRHMLTHDPSHSRPKPELKHSCQICGKCFHTPANVRRHMTVHTGERKYKCEQCSQQFTQKEHYQTHMLRVHTPGAKVYKCTFPGCNRVFVLASLLRSHVKQHETKETFSCQQCDKIVATKSLLKRHMLEHEDPSQTCKCDVCGTLFSSVYKLTQHRKIHTQELVNTCQVCQETFRSINGFRKHAKKKCGRNAYKYKCDYCTRCFFTAAKLTSHWCQDTPGTRGKKHTPGAQNVAARKHTCQVCLKQLSGFKQFKRHAEQKCGRQAYPYACKKCSSCFFKKMAMKGHMRIHKTGIYGLKCGTCEKRFRRFIGLQIHIVRTGHEVADARFMCKVCQKKFPSSAMLETHFATHTTEEVLRCSSPTRTTEEVLQCSSPTHTTEEVLQCSSPTYTTEEVLQCSSPTHTTQEVLQCSSPTHTTQEILQCSSPTHTTQEVLRCSSPTQTTESEESLPQSPLRTDQDSQYACNKCSRMFPSKVDLLSHIAADHSFAFICQVCGERFKRRDEVKLHLKVQHDE